MHRRLLPLAALLLATPLSAQDAPAPELSLEQRMLLRCSATFAMVAHGQETGNAEALQYPPLAESGREFFVQASARVMDETGLSIEELTVVLQREAQDLVDKQQVEAMMPVCLPLLPQSGL
ncbi:hypothetical protein [Alteraurantiacibacter aquimixticola]|uniref:Uncharacterized protein n=1 Tax=Alteraurantiacibacter aquimixticola TaxID=2489173 RepID=A0A4T3F0S7_9SPHN|nr:hypothetical protein [Alteraurantiacibacter aquimixticola]TIX49517.1 hypothetical protein E5222_11760 [Alteraurantiacibacter aquimixticola]